MKQTVDALEKAGMLKRIRIPVDPYLEMAAIHRRVNSVGGPALLFENVKGSSFMAVSNLFGTKERAYFLLRKTIQKMKTLVAIRAEAKYAVKNIGKTLSIIPWLPSGIPKKKFFFRNFQEINISQLPMVHSWPKDGGAFITLPQVYSENPLAPNIFQSNMGMYRVQLNGNQYQLNKNVGMHYQLHRGIGIHHHAAIEAGKPLKVSVFIGGPPAHSLAAVMPLPEAFPEVMFAGLLANRRFRFIRQNGNVVSTDADFVITGEVIQDETLPEGPFGDHLGYYSLTHNFPVMRVHKVYARKGAIWPFTVVGRPPQEDSVFGKIIHEITSPMVPASLPGVKAVHAVDASGVHPLLLAIGSERYVPYEKRKPLELMSIAHSILGFNQMTLAKYLFLVSYEDNPALDINNVADFLNHLLERVDFSRDLHFITETTMDTLDYSGNEINHGSKLVIVAAGERKRKLWEKWPEVRLSSQFKDVQCVIPGVFAVSGPRFKSYTDAQKLNQKLENAFASLQKNSSASDNHIPALVVLVDDAKFTAKTMANFLWVTFTRSNPSHDIYGGGSFIKFKHWGCMGPLIIDARIKSNHAPILEDDPKIVKKIDSLFAQNGPLNKLL